MPAMLGINIFLMMASSKWMITKANAHLVAAFQIRKRGNRHAGSHRKSIK